MTKLLLLAVFVGCGGTPKSEPATPASTDDAAGRGRAVYENKGCNSCHTIDGSPRVGPTWKGLWNSDVALANGKRVHVDVAYLRSSIMTPQADVVEGYPPTMPTFQGNITDRELDDVIAFIQSLH